MKHDIGNATTRAELPPLIIAYLIYAIVKK